MRIKKFNIISIAIFIVLFVGYVSYIVKDERNLNIFEMVLKDSVYIFSKPFVKDKNIDFTSSFYRSKMEEYENEIKDLKNLLNLKNTLSNYSVINATVLNRNVGYWYNTITIDKGKNDDILVGDAVSTSDGLIGSVIRTSFTTSTVKLYSNTDNKLSVKIESNGKSIYGLLTSYDKVKKVYKIDGISDNSDILKGSTVVTTGLDDIPSGILVGFVNDIKTDNFELTKIIEVTPSVDYDDIKYIAILKKGKK